MLNEIAKKLALKKTFFMTQLDSFFNALQNEYQEIIHKQDLELSLLKEKVQKYSKDIENLVKIRDNLSKQITQLKAENSRLKLLLSKKENGKVDDSLIKENSELSKKVESLEYELERLSKENRMLLEIKDKILDIQSNIAKGTDSYSQNLLRKKSEDIIKEIKETLKK